MPYFPPHLVLWESVFCLARTDQGGATQLSTSVSRMDPGSPTVTKSSESPGVTQPPQPQRSTPPSLGTRTHTKHLIQHRQLDYQPYLTEDLRESKEMTLSDFLDVIFGAKILAGKNLPDNFTTAEWYTRASAKYKEAAHEHSYYQTFVEWANDILKALGLSHHLVFCRNDRTCVRGSPAERCPDVVIIRPGSLNNQRMNRFSVDDMALKGPSDNPFHWGELLSFFEFKYLATVIGGLQPHSTRRFPIAIVGTKPKNLPLQEIGIQRKLPARH